ncbi:MAG: PQQ-binding-like beta-propeller repeat protein [Pirellulales bacterium]
MAQPEPAAADWPFVRGPEYDGRSAEVGLAQAWPDAGPPVLWVQPLGAGYSGFVAEGERVYTQRQSLAGQFVVCLDANTGENVWEYRYGLPYEPLGLYPGPRATPTLSGGRIYFAGTDGLVGCLNGQGGLLWSVELYQRFSGQPPGFGYACSPVVADGLVYLPVGVRGASLVALEDSTGQTAWQAGDDAASYSPVYPIVLEGRRIILGYMENALVAHDARDGTVLWRNELSHGYDEHSAWPIYREPHLWISGPFRAGSQLMQLNAVGQPPRDVWKKPLLSNDVASSILVNGHLYGFDLRDMQAKLHRPSRGKFCCVDFLTGQEKWSTEATGHASVLSADGMLILLNDTGQVLLARATPDSYQELARCTALGGEIGWTTPMLHRRKLYLRNQSRAVCIWLGTDGGLQDEKLVKQPTSVADLPQTRYRDWSLLLGVEPEFMMDVPGCRWLRQWYGVSLVLVILARLLAWPGRWLEIRWGWRPGSLCERIFWVAAFVLGCLGTPLASRATGDFVFTWHVALFSAFAACVAQLPSVEGGQRWWGRLVAAAFLLVAAAYYLLCRRLNLATEWAFLIGFPAALPLLWGGHWLAARSRWPLLIRSLAAVLAFTAFHWSSVFWLACKYDIPA